MPRRRRRRNVLDVAGEDRLALVRSMRLLGNTLQDIGDAFGVSRERARQLCDRAGVPHAYHDSRTPDAIALLRVARAPNVARLSECARALGAQKNTVQLALTRSGRWPAIKRLWAWRRGGGAQMAEALLRKLQMFYVAHGRSPTHGEMGNGPDAPLHRVAGMPSVRQLQRRFGSLDAAFALAGIPRRKPGRAAVALVYQPTAGDTSP